MEALVYVFKHGQFIQAARAIVSDPEFDNHAQMRAFWRDGTPLIIGNVERIGCHLESESGARGDETNHFG